MRTSLLFILATLLSACAHERAALPGSFAEDALIQAGSVCHTFDVRSSNPQYICFVSSHQASPGVDASTEAGRAAIIRHKLAAVCTGIKVESDEMFRADSDSGTTTWRLHARCSIREPAPLAIATCEEHMVADGRMTGADLPDGARGREYNELVTVRYDLDGSGRAVNPRIVHGSTRGIFDPVTIELLERARFLPGVTARDCLYVRTYSAARRR